MLIISMLGGLAVAGYQSQLKTQRADNALNDFMVFLQSARSAAIIQRTEVVLCPAAWTPSFGATLAANTATHCGSSNTWDQGAVAFTDHNSDLQINGQDEGHCAAPSKLCRHRGHLARISQPQLSTLQQKRVNRLAKRTLHFLLNQYGARGYATNHH